MGNRGPCNRAAARVQILPGDGMALMHRLRVHEPIAALEEHNGADWNFSRTKKNQLPILSACKSLLANNDLTVRPHIHVMRVILLGPNAIDPSCGAT